MAVNISNRRKTQLTYAAVIIGSLIVSSVVLRSFVYKSVSMESSSMENTIAQKDSVIFDNLIYKSSRPKIGEILLFHAPPAASDGKDLDLIKRCIASEGDTVEVTPPRIMAGNKEIDSIAMTGMDWHRLLREVLTTQEGSVKFTNDGVSIDGAKPLSIEDFQMTLKARLAAYTKANGPSLTVAMAQQLVDAGTDLEINPGKTLVNGKALVEPYIREDPDYVMPTVKVGKDEVFVLGDNRNFSHDSHMWGPLQVNRVVGKVIGRYSDHGPLQFGL